MNSTVGDRRVRFLASVTSVAEARVAARTGADIIDGKDPAAGALGALGAATIRAICEAVPRGIPVSATIGDLPCEPARVAEAVREVAATGVAFVKVGFFPEGDAAATLAKLGTLSLGHARLVGVLLADRSPDLGLIDGMRRAGFAGVMLDTAEKRGGALIDHLPRSVLSAFIAAAREAGLFAGLAGSLRLAHIPMLVPLGPDVLGFRGALCRSGVRESEIDVEAVQTVRGALRQAASLESVP